ncbi:MAG: DUF58 domain-containing protein, partial [Verrucomicrobiota bacterium]
MEGQLETCDELDTRQFLLAVRRMADSFSYGTDRSPFLGSGIEYVQSRPYEYGDPVKNLDWRVTARTGRYHVKEYEAPKRMPCWLLIDTSASMTISSQARSKYAQAVHIAGGLALACLDRVSPVGILGVGEQDLRVEPSLSREQILQWMHRLRTYRFDERTSLSRRIVELNPSLTSTSLVIVLSDLYDAEALPALKQLAQRHDVAVIQLADPAESELGGAGFIRGREAETGTSFTTLSRRVSLGKDRVASELKRGRIDHLYLPTNEPVVLPLRPFFESR